MVTATGIFLVALAPDSSISPTTTSSKDSSLVQHMGPAHCYLSIYRTKGFVICYYLSTLTNDSQFLPLGKHVYISPGAEPVSLSPVACHVNHNLALDRCRVLTGTGAAGTVHSSQQRGLRLHQGFDTASAHEHRPPDLDHATRHARSQGARNEFEGCPPANFRSRDAGEAIRQEAIEREAKPRTEATD